MTDVILRRITPEGLRHLAGLRPMGRDGKRKPVAGPQFPWVGIPVPGKPPMVVSRKKLQAVLRDTHVQLACVVQGEERGRVNGGCNKFLGEITEAGQVYRMFCGAQPAGVWPPPIEYCIECDDKRVRPALSKGLRLQIGTAAPGHRRLVFGRYVFLDQRDITLKGWELGKKVREWKERTQGRTQGRTQTPQAPQAQVKGDYQRKRYRAQERKLMEGIAKIKKQLAQHTQYHSSGRLRCMFLGKEDSDHSASPDQRAREMGWRFDKPARRKLGWHVAAMVRNKMSPAKMYAALGVLGYPLQTWSELNTDQRRKFGELQSNYWKHVFMVQGSGCAGRKPHRDSLCYIRTGQNYPTPLQEAEALRARLAEHQQYREEQAEWLRVKKSFESQVEGLEQELEAFRAGTQGKLGECPDCGTNLGLNADRELWCPDCEDVKTPKEAEEKS